jgi:hypothetical protein
VAKPVSDSALQKKQSIGGLNVSPNHHRYSLSFLNTTRSGLMQKKKIKQPVRPPSPPTFVPTPKGIRELRSRSSPPVPKDRQKRLHSGAARISIINQVGE